MATMTITFAELTEQIEKRVLAEQRIKELEAKLAEVTLNPPKKTRKPAVKKERTPEEEEALHLKRVEAGKKGAAVKKAIAEKRKAEEEAARIAEARAKFLAEMAAAEEAEEPEPEIEI